MLPSSLYKETGVSHDTPGTPLGVSPTTPQDLARKVAGRRDGATIFGRHSLVSVVDERVPDKGFRILALLECCCWDAPTRLAFEEIAAAVNSSRPQVIRHIRALESLGYITVRRAHNKRNEYAVPGVTGVRVRGTVVAPVVVEKPKRITVQCPKCSRPVPALLRVGWCRACNWELKVRRIAQDEMRKTA
jgi:DNA-binding Lrp family transcriptional regulator